MKQLNIAIILLLFTNFAQAQLSQNQNYVATMTPQQKMTMVGNTPTSYQPEQVLSTVQYFDGLGRPTQSIQYKASPLKKDIISFTQYDGMGRVAKEYLPFTSKLFSNQLTFVQDVETKQAQFYSANSNVANIAKTAVPFSEKVFDGSPLNRVIEQGAPGNDWQIGTNHTVKSEFLINKDEEILQYVIDNSDRLKLEGFWPQGQLIGSRVTDEHGRHTVEFKDKVLDRVYVKRVENEGGQWHDTYYVYDKKGHLAYVLPPMLISESLGMSNGGNVSPEPPPVSATNYENYSQTFPCENFLVQNLLGVPLSCNGDVTVQIANDVLTITFNITNITNGRYKNGVVATLNTNPTLPAINFGDLPVVGTIGSAQLYTGLSLPGSTGVNLMISANSKGSLTEVNQVFTHALTGSENEEEPEITYESYPSPLPTGLVYTNFINDWGYQYKYDKRRRLIAKKLPGKEWELIVYNEQDLPILTQDGQLRGNKRWLFTKYDEYDRPIATGSVKVIDQNASDGLNLNPPSVQTISNLLQYQKDMQTYVLNHNQQTGNAHWEEVSTNDPLIEGYSNKSYPTHTSSSEIEVYSINYYDDYDFDGNGSADQSYVSRAGYTQPTTGTVKGQLTATKVKVLDGTNRWTMAINFYDQYGRVKQTKNWNAIGEWDVTWNEYDFTGKVVKTFTERSKNLVDLENITFANKPTIQNIREERAYTYDHAGRLKKTTLALNGDTTPEVLAQNDYNELGELIKKDIGNTATAPLQTVDYDYNIRGWLTGINRSLTSNSNYSPDLFGMELHYNKDHVLSGNAQYNGNISGYTWTSITDGIQRKYGFAYDGLNRLRIADYEDNYSSTNQQFDVGINDSPISYDRNGNIRSLQRMGLKGSSGNYGIMDDLTYTYGKGNQLKKVHDADTHHAQYDVDVAEFKDNANVSTEYTYDKNGNMISDLNKNISSILYNHLNLPTKVMFNNGQPYVEWTYDAAGMKVKKKTGNTIKWYVGGVEYATTNAGQPSLEAIYHEEGRITPDGSGWQYEYTLSDHLGNARVSFTDLDNNGKINPNTEILQTQSYYPFGLVHSNPNDVQIGTENKYQYNGKELQSEMGWSDFGLRMYDPSIGRWTTVDPLANHRDWLTPYNYVQNNPLLRFDPNGLTDFTLIDGVVTQVGETNDEPDRILKTNKRGRIKRYKKGKKEGEAKVAIDDIAKGILEDGQDFKEGDTAFEVGGEGQPTVQDVESFVLKLSDYVGKEISGAYFTVGDTDETTHLTIGKYKNNRHKKSGPLGAGAMVPYLDFEKDIDALHNAVTGMFHTHPSGGTISDSDRLHPSGQDIETRDEALEGNPNLLFFILTDPEYGHHYPRKIEYTPGSYNDDVYGYKKKNK